ncbi:transposase [Streptomyces sp. NPDC093801]|uniref:transposase n=1 Tax=Streptomyces sp. NPDC093801 TaxID=3155203 RepID=UPI003450D7AB
MVDRKPYSSDVSNEQWVLIEPVISAWKAGRPSASGHHGRYAMREIVNVILYQNRTGWQWDLLPHGLPPAGAVKYSFASGATTVTTRPSTIFCGGSCGRRSSD